MTEVESEYINVPSLDALAEHGVERIAAAVGVFDGIHMGHQKLFSELIEMAKKENAVPVALTFYPHPKQVLQPESPPVLLLSQAKKIELIHELGVKAVVTMPFTKEFASLHPHEFITECLKAPRVSLCGICVGTEWRFGANGEGSISLLHDFANEGHFSFKAVDELYIDGRLVSSTSIRRAVSSGRLDEAEKMLGRPYMLEGIIETGRKIAGPTLSRPTANLKVRNGIIPPDGVYAGRALVDGERYPAAIAVGVSPTFRHFGELKKRVEVHLLGFSGDIYGKKLEVDFLKYLREERCFSSASALKQQIEEDIEKITGILEGK